MNKIKPLPHQEQVLVESMNPAENLQALVREFLLSGDKRWVEQDLKNRNLNTSLLPEPSSEIIRIHEWEELHELYEMDEIFFLWRVGVNPDTELTEFIIII